MSFVAEEIASQPDCWHRAAELAGGLADALPRPGERVAVTGCGTSWFVAQSYAALRESAGQGVTDAFAASEMPARRYDRVLAITRSGTTTEVLRLLDTVTGPVTVLTGVPDAVGDRGRVIDLGFADERSVVQTRFATTVLALLRTALGGEVTGAAEQARAVLAEPVPDELVRAEQFTFLGTGACVGIAHEAALKLREASGSWAESYPALEYRHGPISITGPNRVAWVFGGVPDGLAADVLATGGIFVHHGRDPLADLVAAQRLAVALAEHRGLDPDQPRHLTRSVVLG